MTTPTPKDNGGPAFPHVGEQFNHDIGERETVTTMAGMSLRDYFAAKALQGMLADQNFNHNAYKAAALCYAVADAMLEERAA